MLAGHVMFGAFDELTVIVVVQLAVLLALSVELHVTVVAPRIKEEPEAG